MASKKKERFGSSVFINCPFDRAYLSLLRPIVFTVVSCGFVPKLSLNRSDSAEQRIDKICKLIVSARYSIHDISRLQASKKGDLARHNMPFELGIDYGCRRFGSRKLRQKQFLVLEKERYRFAKALSDLAGVDIQKHDDDPKVLIRVLRNWFYATAGKTNVLPAGILNSRFIDFMGAFNAKTKSLGFDEDDINDMTMPELVKFIRKWIKDNPRSAA